jgi:NAD(P)-dependent dehydrogenase (short-subunit alcohol dehydrogenase family)
VAQTIAERHGEANIVISNAARISREVSSEQQVRTFADTNNYGTVRMIKGLADPGVRQILRMVKIIFGWGLVRRSASECVVCCTWFPSGCWPRGSAG